METIATRIIQVVNWTGGNKSEFARRINVSPAYISKLDKQPDRSPSDRTISDICREFRVNEQWLRHGEGEPFLSLSREEEIAAFVGDVLSSEPSDFRRRVIHVMSRMTMDDWKFLEKRAIELMAEFSASGSSDESSEDTKKDRP